MDMDLLLCLPEFNPSRLFVAFCILLRQSAARRRYFPQVVHYFLNGACDGDRVRMHDELPLAGIDVLSLLPLPVCFSVGVHELINIRVINRPSPCLGLAHLQPPRQRAPQRTNVILPEPPRTC